MIGRLRDSKEDVAPASGTLEINFGSPQLGQFWLIDRVYYNAKTTLTRLNVYVGQRVNFNIVDTSTSLINVADNAKPIHVPEGHDLIFRFTGLTPTDQPIVNVQGRIMENLKPGEPDPDEPGRGVGRSQPFPDDIVRTADGQRAREVEDNRYRRRQPI